MKKIAWITAIGFVGMEIIVPKARAQEVRIPTNPVGPQEYRLSVTPQELLIIGKGLGTQPFNDVQPLMQKLSAQVTEQNVAAKPKADDKPKDEPKKK